MTFALLALLVAGPSISFAQPILQPKFEIERRILLELNRFSSKTVNDKACITKKIRVGEILAQFILLAAQPEVSGRTKQLSFQCENRKGKKAKFADPENCKLSFGELIRLPNEPEGWSRSLFFTYDYQRASIEEVGFRCLDVP